MQAQDKLRDYPTNLPDTITDETQKERLPRPSEPNGAPSHGDTSLCPDSGFASSNKV